MNPQGYQTGERAHEHKDADVVNLGMIAGLLLLSLAISMLACWGILHAFNRTRNVQEPPRIEMVKQDARFPRHRRLAAKAQLQTYGWVDRQAGIAHIPIDKAKQLLLARGLPEVGAGQTRLQLMQSRPQTSAQPKEPITSPAPEASP